MARDYDRLREDQAGIGPDPGSLNRLHRLSDSHHYRIATGEPDIRGWEVRTLAGAHIGEVEDLLIDPYRGEVVMLDVDVDNSPDRVNVPIRGVQLDRSRRCVIVDSGDMRDAQAAVLHSDVHETHRGHDVDDRLEDARARSDDLADAPRDIRYSGMRDVDTRDNEGVVEERVVERRPIVEEEVVVRRRVVDDDTE